MTHRRISLPRLTGPIQRRILAPLTLALCLAAPMAQAHPHIFVSVTHQVLFDDDGHAIGLRATWDYDEMFTLLMVEDGGYDSNGDGAVSGDELEAFRLWDAQWPDDYDGDVRVSLDGAAVTLGAPQDWQAEWTEGRAVSMHTRLFADPLDLGGHVLQIKPYDPAFYIDYTVAAPPELVDLPEGAACTARVEAPGEDAVPEDIARQIADLSPMMTPEEAGLPQVGEFYAHTEYVTCD